MATQTKISVVFREEMGDERASNVRKNRKSNARKIFQKFYQKNKSIEHE